MKKVRSRHWHNKATSVIRHTVSKETHSDASNAPVRYRDQPISLCYCKVNTTCLCLTVKGWCGIIEAPFSVLITWYYSLYTTEGHLQVKFYYTTLLCAIWRIVFRLRVFESRTAWRLALMDIHIRKCISWGNTEITNNTNESLNTWTPFCILYFVMI